MRPNFPVTSSSTAEAGIIARPSPSRTRYASKLGASRRQVPGVHCGVAGFRYLVFALVACVPAGCVTSYGRLAELLGYSGKAREVGWALHSTPEDLNLNAHRVVRHDGAMAGGSAFGAPEVQRALLEEEGVTFLADGRVDLKRHLWSGAAARAAASEILGRSAVVA